MITCSLPECQEVFNQNSAGNKKFCSPEHQRLAWMPGIVSVCASEDCNKEFSPKDKRTKYCSRSCAAHVNNMLNPKRVASGTRQCKKCDNRIEMSLALCDDCRIIGVRMKRGPKYIEDWLLGNESGSDSTGQLKNRCRNYLIEVADNKCQSSDCCVPGGWGVPNPITGKPILTVDHIDGNWKNNSVDNLVVLCYNCHTLTSTFGSLNKKSAGIRGSGNRAYKEHSMKRKANEKYGDIG